MPKKDRPELGDNEEIMRDNGLRGGMYLFAPSSVVAVRVFDFFVSRTMEPCRVPNNYNSPPFAVAKFLSSQNSVTSNTSRWKSSFKENYLKKKKKVSFTKLRWKPDLLLLVHRFIEF